MNPILAFLSSFVFVLALINSPTVVAANASTEHSPPYCAEESSWESLFNGDSLARWEFIDSGPASWIDSLAFWRRLGEHGGWRIDKQGHLYRGASAGDLRTRREFGNFELKLDWKISSGGNSGIKLRVADENGEPSNTGFEMQILDDANHKDGTNPLTSSGALYGLYPSAYPAAAKPAGEWNHVHIRVVNKHIVFTLNGFETVSAELGTPDWLNRLSKSPQRDRVSSRFAQFDKGHILLQDHFDDVWFRDIKICELPAAKTAND